MTCQYEGRFFLTHALERVADVLDGNRVGQPDIQLVQRCDGVALSEQLVRHIRQQIQQNRASHILRHGQQTFHAEHQKARRGQIRVTVEEFRVRAAAHGVQPQQDLLERLARVELRLRFIKILVLDLDEIIQFRKNGIVLRPHLRKIRFLCNAPFRI